MISFEDGFAQIMALGSPLTHEIIDLEDAMGRVLSTNLQANRAQPAFDISAMDGFALCGESDSYQIIGEVQAGSNLNIELKHSQAARIFTGAKIPQGADRVLIQENSKIENDLLKPVISSQKGAHIRAKGQDFNIGFAFIAPKTLTSEDIALIAAMNFGKIEVYNKPKVAIIPTGNELVQAGQANSNFELVASSAYGLKAMVTKHGGLATIFPIVKDSLAELTRVLRELHDFDLIVTTGGASVGKYDFTFQAAVDAGFDIAIHKIAMRPGKPVIAGTKDGVVLLGLPGNPVSGMIAARLFLLGLLNTMCGMQALPPLAQKAILEHDLPANGDRTHFMRALISQAENGFLAKIFTNQDSAILSVLSKSNGLVKLSPNQPILKKGENVEFIWV